MATHEPSAGGHPHDALFRLVFSDPHNTQSELRSVIPPDLAARIDLDALELRHGTFVDEALQHRHTDLLFRTTVDGHDAYVYLLVEHQRTADQLMALRMLNYQGRIWEHHVAGERPRVASTPLPMIVPVVIYQGTRRWSAPTDIAGLLDADDVTRAAAGELLPRVRYVVDDLTLLDDGALRARSLTPAARITFVAFTKAPDDSDVTAWLGSWSEDFRRLLESPGHARLLDGIFTYLLKVSTTPVTQLTEFAATLGTEAEEVAVTTAQRLHAMGFNEGRQEGREKGREEGEARMLLKMLELRFGQLDGDTRGKVESATVEQTTAWAARLVQGATTLDEVFAS